MRNLVFADLRRIRMTKVQSAIFIAVASLFFWQWQLSSLAVGTSSASRNSLTGSGNALCILFPTKNVLDLEEAKTAQAKEIVCLKKKVKTLELKRKSRTSGLKRLRKVRTASIIKSSTEASLGHQEDASKQQRMIDSIDQDVEITLDDETQGRMNKEDMFRVNDLDGDEVIIDVIVGKNVEQSTKVTEKVVSIVDPVTTADIEVTTAATTPQISKDELTLAQTLIVIKAAKHKAITTAATIVTAAGTRTKAKRIVMQEPSERSTPTPIDSSQKLSQAKDKGKGKMMLFNNTMKWIEAFVPMDTELVKSNEKAAKDNAKAAEDSEKAKEDDDDVIIKATPLSSKSLTIVDYKIYKEGKKSYSKIIGADGNSQSYLAFGKMFKNINRESLKVLWSIVKARFKKIKPIDDMDNLLF
uniref:Uncharacterized protein n=1 Tax=Tanacetum cinerariifolium TaxID=118510 RepID=A0A699GMM5_TANCI|nr:hypothetical protein [Tanacetum cinerariifolium]